MNFMGRFSNGTQISNVLKIRFVEAELLQADGRTGLKLIVVFQSFANAPVNQSVNVV
jgi:hypothetical protein